MKPKNEITLKKLAEELGGELVGRGEASIKNICDIEEAGTGDLAFIMKKRSEPMLEKTKASCVVVPPQVQKAAIPIIKCKNPNLAFKKAAEIIFGTNIPHPDGIHKTAFVGEGAALGKNVSLGAYVVIEKGARIGDGTVIYSHSFVGASSVIDEDSIIYPNVTIRENIKIGKRVIIHSGCVIGADGYGYERTLAGHEKIPHIGDVIIEDDVELGALVTVDRAKMAHTRIGKGTKIDNLVQIAHNVTIGQNCLMAAQCGISGSVKVGNNVVMGGQVGIADHLEIGDNCMLAAQAAIMKSVPPNSIMWGKPARPLKQAKAVYAMFDKLPEMYARLKALEEKLGLKK
ncbi:UDP-3-O-(3-hydroxymyristoyl)glucosamine N-acyltransferase [Candidatus Omnitrophota bacterium]